WSTAEKLIYRCNEGLMVAPLSPLESSYQSQIGNESAAIVRLQPRADRSMRRVTNLADPVAQPNEQKWKLGATRDQIQLVDRLFSYIAAVGKAGKPQQCSRNVGRSSDEIDISR